MGFGHADLPELILWPTYKAEETWNKSFKTTEDKNHQNLQLQSEEKIEGLETKQNENVQAGNLHSQRDWKKCRQIPDYQVPLREKHRGENSSKSRKTEKGRK